MTAPELARCPSCRAPHGPDEAFCWMCHERLWDGKAPAPKAPAPPAKDEPAPAPSPAPVPKRKPAVLPGAQRPYKAPKRPRFEFVDDWIQPVLVAAFVLVLTGLAMGSANGTALMWLGLLPAFFVLALAGFQEPKKEPETLLEKAQWLATKLASVLAILIIAAGALFLALAAACAAIIGGLYHH